MSYWIGDLKKLKYKRSMRLQKAKQNQRIRPSEATLDTKHLYDSSSVLSSNFTAIFCMLLILQLSILITCNQSSLHTQHTRQQLGHVL